MKKSITRKNRKDNKKLIKEFQKEVALLFFEVLFMIKIYHWKTDSYPAHKASDELYESLNKKIDNFIEVLLGKTNSRIDMTNKNKFKLIECKSKKEMIQNMEIFKRYLVNLDNNKAIQSMSNLDLFTIRDEILADINQFLYLLTFK